MHRVDASWLIPDPVPYTSPMQILALDIGGKRTGVASGDTELRIPMPVETLEHPLEPGDALIAAIRRVIADHGPDTLVVGLPLNMDGTESPMAKRIRAFAARVAEATGLAVGAVPPASTDGPAGPGLPPCAPGPWAPPPRTVPPGAGRLEAPPPGRRISGPRRRSAPAAARCRDPPGPPAGRSPADWPAGGAGESPGPARSPHPPGGWHLLHDRWMVSVQLRFLLQPLHR